MMTHRALTAPIALVGAVALAPATASASTAGRTSIDVPLDFPTIQAAVDAAAPGATIHVEPGTYTDQIRIIKDLDLRGTGADTTVTKSPPALTPIRCPRTGRRTHSVDRADHHGAHVRMSGFTVTGPIPVNDR